MSAIPGEETYQLRVETGADVQELVALLPEKQADGTVVFTDARPIAQEGDTHVGDRGQQVGGDNVFLGDVFVDEKQAALINDVGVRLMLMGAGEPQQQQVMASKEGADGIGYGN
jgi:hypothetical protein